MRRWWSALVLMALIMIIAGLAQTKQGYALLGETGLYETPASYTELAFTTPGNLPGQLKLERTPIDVSFGIHNVSSSSRSYRWSIVFVRSGKNHLAASGVVSAPAQGRATVARTVALSCTDGRLQVVVRLVNPDESIDFWATCPQRSRSVR